MTYREKLIRLANDWYDEAFKASRKQAIDEVLEIIECLNHNGSVSIKLLRKELEVLKGGERE